MRIGLLSEENFWSSGPLNDCEKIVWVLQKVLEQFGENVDTFVVINGGQTDNRLTGFETGSRVMGETPAAGIWRVDEHELIVACDAVLVLGRQR
jgi:hypothetical protein